MHTFIWLMQNMNDPRLSWCYIGTHLRCCQGASTIKEDSGNIHEFVRRQEKLLGSVQYPRFISETYVGQMLGRCGLRTQKKEQVIDDSVSVWL